MANIKTARAVNIILSLSEIESAHLLGLLNSANSYRNEVVSEIENSLEVELDGVDRPEYLLNDEGYFEVQE